LWPARPRSGDLAWSSAHLTAQLAGQFARQPAHDQRHAIRVARGVEARLAGTEYAGDPTWIEAALLHDLGKLDSRLGIFARVGATISAHLAGHDLAEAWAGKRGLTRRFGLYVLHPRLGAERIRLGGGSASASAWAGAHHDDDPAETSGLPSAVVAALVACDDD
jgi:hypothetical protein